MSPRPIALATALLLGCGIAALAPSARAQQPPAPASERRIKMKAHVGFGATNSAYPGWIPVFVEIANGEVAVRGARLVAQTLDLAGDLETCRTPKLTPDRGRVQARPREIGSRPDFRDFARLAVSRDPAAA